MVNNSELTPDTVIKKCTDLTERDLGDEIVVIKTGVDEIHSFSETGLDLWREIERQPVFRELISLIASEYKVDEKATEKDLTVFLEECREKGLLLYKNSL